MAPSEILQAVLPPDICFLEQARVNRLSNWYAIYVKSRHEFFAVNELRRNHIETFLPSVKKVSQWKDRKKTIEWPLFPGYLFVRILPHPEVFLNVLRTRGVVTFISLEPGKPTPIASEEIASLRLLIESGKELDIYPHLKEGTRVRIKSGPLQNAEGILTAKEKEYLLQVNVELLGRSVAIKITPNDVEAV